MARRSPRINLSRLTYNRSRKRAPIWNDSIYHFGGVFLLCFLLGFLSQQARTNSRNRSSVTPNRNNTTKPISSSTAKNSSLIILRSYYNLSSPQHSSRESFRGSTSLVLNSSPRTLFYSPSSMRVH